MAIAYDASSKSSASATSVTFAHTCTGSDRLLMVNAYWAGSATVSSITYNGVAMTNVVSPLDTGGGERHGMFYLVAPATGANNVVLTLSGSTDIEVSAVSYTGVHQSSPIDATRTETGLETGTSYSEAITSVVDNCWAVWSTREYGGGVVSAGANTALRQQSLVYYGLLLADSNASITPAGSRTMELTKGVSGNWFSDILATVNVAPPNYPLTAGVGTFAITGINAGLLYGRNLVADIGSFTLIGINVLLNRGYGIITSVGSFILTGIAVTFRLKRWNKASKSNTTSWSNRSKSNTSSWTNQTK